MMTMKCVPNFSLWLGAVRCDRAHQVTVDWQQSICRRSGTHRSCTNGGVVREVRVSELLECQVPWIKIVSTALDCKKWSLHTSQVAHQARAYSCFCSMKWLVVFLLPLDGMLVHCRVTPSIKFAATHLYTCVKRGTVRVKCPQPGVEPWVFHPEICTLTMRPTYLHTNYFQYMCYNSFAGMEFDHNNAIIWLQADIIAWGHVQ